MKPVTVWVCWNPPVKAKPPAVAKPGYWSFNHIEDGHSSAATPADPFGRGWQHATWRKAHGHLNDDSPPKLDYERVGILAGEP